MSELIVGSFYWLAWPFVALVGVLLGYRVAKMAVNELSKSRLDIDELSKQTNKQIKLLDMRLASAEEAARHERISNESNHRMNREKIGVLSADLDAAQQQIHVVDQRTQPNPVLRKL